MVDIGPPGDHEVVLELHLVAYRDRPEEGTVRVDPEVALLEGDGAAGPPRVSSLLAVTGTDTGRSRPWSDSVPRSSPSA